MTEETAVKIAAANGNAAALTCCPSRMSMVVASSV